MKEVKDLVGQVNNFLDVTISARSLSERDEDYDNHQQWTDAEEKILEQRNQPPVVINRTKIKVNLLTGMQTLRRTQPRALPRTPKHSDGADAITEALRFVADNTNFKTKSSAAFRSKIVSGYGGGIIEFGENDEVVFNKIPWDRYFFDPYSRELDFSDKNYDGIQMWMDKEDAINEWPDKADELRAVMADQTSGDETFDDKPTNWIDTKRDRIRVAQHFFKEKGVWKMAFYTQDLYLEEPKDSPFLDENGKPDNPIEMQTAYIDRQLQRYGEVRGYIWLQDEINHRRSRLLYAGSVNRTMGEDGAVDDVNEMKQELAKANGHVKVNKGFSFEILDNNDISETQLLLYRESKQEIDELGANPALAGRGRARSGRQEQIQQQGGIAELATLYDGHKDFENRVYRQMWNRVRQSWTAEKWIRVTDDPKNLEWVGLNHEVTNGDLLMEAADNGSEDALAILQQMTNAGDPRLNEVAEVRNNVAEINVDIVIADAPDVHTLRQETADMLLALAERYGADEVPFAAALEVLDIPNKDAVKKLLKPDQQRIDAQNIAQQLEMESKQAEINAKKAKASRDMVEAQAQEIENQLVMDKYPNIVADRDSESVAKQLDNQQKQLETTKLALEPITSVNVNT